MRFFIRSVAFSLLPSAFVFGQVYEITEIPSFRADGQGETYASAINENDVVVGAAARENGARAPFRRMPNGQMLDLGFINSLTFQTTAAAINNSNVVAGNAQTQPGGFGSAWRFSDATGLVDLPELGGGDSVANGINSAGVLVGWANKAQGCGAPDCVSNPGFAVKWVGNAIQEVPGLGGYFSVAVAINDSGEICGYGATNGAWRGFRVGANSSVRPLAGLAAGNVQDQPLSMNNPGTIVGYAGVSGGARHAAVWRADTAEDLGTLPGFANSYAYCVSDTGIIVGAAFNNSSDARAVIFRRDGTPIDLNDLIDTSSGWTLRYAEGVNYSGRIVGEGTKNGVMRGFILTATLRLSIQRTAESLARVSWPAIYSNYVLESTDTLPSASWSPVNAPVTQVLENVGADVNISGAARYFRLKAPVGAN
jgi:uncharacterized membrane protein